MKPLVPGRLHALGLDAPRFTTAAEVVRHLGCVQSQLHDMALWGVARRTTGATLADLQDSFDRGEFTRTHVLRPTWHFIAPEDLHWLHALTGPRVSRLARSSNAVIGLTTARLDQAADVITQALREGGALTRPELGAALASAGLPHRGQALAHAVMHAEVNALVTSGPMRGKQHTYAVLAPRRVTQTHDELLAAVATRYGRGHGMFRDKDLAWWTSLTLTDSRRAVDLAGLRPTEHDGQTYWSLDEPAAAVTDVPRVMLLPNFDEYISFARDPVDFAAIGGAVPDILRSGGLLVLDGLLAGAWSRTVAARTVEVRVEVAGRLTAGVMRAIEAEAEAFGRFVGREPVLTLGA